MANPEDRLEQIVSRLLAGRRPRVDRRDAAEKDAVIAATRLAGAREPYPTMSPAFRERLARLVEERESPRLTRRNALLGGAAAAAGLLVGAGLERGLTPTASPPAEATRTKYIRPQPGRWVDVVAMSDLPEGQAVPVNAGAVQGFVIRSGDAVSGVSSICSHYPCALWWDGAERNIVCPCHMKRFSTSGEPLAGSYDVPGLMRLHVRVVEGRVQVFGT